MRINLLTTCLRIDTLKAMRVSTSALGVELDQGHVYQILADGMLQKIAVKKIFKDALLAELQLIAGNRNYVQE